MSKYHFFDIKSVIYKNIKYVNIIYHFLKIYFITIFVSFISNPCIKIAACEMLVSPGVENIPTLNW